MKRASQEAFFHVEESISNRSLGIMKKGLASIFLVGRFKISNKIWLIKHRKKFLFSNL